MPEKGSLSSQRRQAYFKRRRFIEKLEREKSELTFERMTTMAVWELLERSLAETLVLAAQAASVDGYRRARAAWDAYCEIMTRGEQLSLFPREDGPRKPPGWPYTL